MSLLEFILISTTLLLLLVQAVVGAVRPDRIYAFQYWWATYWSRRVLGNADKVQRRYAPAPPRRVLITIRIFSIMTLALFMFAVLLTITVSP